MRLLLVVLFIIVPIAELALLIQVGQLIGVWWTILLLIADAMLGSWLLRPQGRAAWRRFNEALAGGKLPHREVVDGVLIIFGGALLLTPGFITDIFGLLFLIPPTRAVMRRLLVRRGMLKLVGSMPGTASPPNGRPHDIEGTAVDIDPPPRGERRRTRGPAGAAQARGHRRGDVLVGRRLRRAVRARAGRVRRRADGAASASALAVALAGRDTLGAIAEAGAEPPAELTARPRSRWSAGRCGAPAN